MKKETIKKENVGGVYTVIETIETTKEDGLVHESDVHEVGADNVGKYHYGASKHITFTTNDPRITRIFVYSFSLVYFIIGIIMLLIKNYFFGIIFVLSAIVIFIDAKKDIDKIAEEIKEQGGNVIEYDNLKEDYKEEIEIIKENISDMNKSLFTKENFKWFGKLVIVLGTIISSVASLIIGMVAEVKLGLFVFGICIISILLYMFIISKIFKH